MVLLSEGTVSLADAVNPFFASVHLSPQLGRMRRWIKDMFLLIQIVLLSHEPTDRIQDL
jgi:hypothetical protein